MSSELQIARAASSIVAGARGIGRALVHASRAEALELAGQRRLEHQRLPAGGVDESDRRRVQEHALQSQLSQPAIELEVPVLVVAQDRMLEVREVHADLVGAPGKELRFEKAEFGSARHAAEDRL